MDVETCRACGAGGLLEILDLGRLPLANALLTEERLSQPEARFPLRVVLCGECALAQLDTTVPPDILFSEYLYTSSVSSSITEHARSLTAEMMERLGPNRPSLVVEVGSNDGYLLEHYHKASIPVLGIDPARNLSTLAEARGVRTIPDFFGRELADRLARDGIQADLLHANNVMAHVSDLKGFVQGVRTLLASPGLAVIEVPYLLDLIEGAEFDTIYHEHLCYFALTPVVRLFEACGLTVTHVDRIPIHGGSIRIYASRSGSGVSASEAVQEMLDQEVAWGVRTIESYRSFADAVRSVKVELSRLLKELKAGGATVAAYGAAAKGATLLGYVGVTDEIEYVVDKSPLKQGRYTPGTHLPVVSPETFETDRPDYTLLLPWNLADEIFEEQRTYRERGGRFIVPLPRPHIA